MFRRLVLLWLVLAVVLVTGRAQADGPRTYGVGVLRTVALSPDGTRLAAGTAIGTYLYDAATFAPLGFWPSAVAVSDLRWSPAGDTLAATLGGSLQVLSAATGDVLWSLPLPRYSSDLAYSPTGAYLAVANGETMTVRDARTGQVAFTLDHRAHPTDCWRDSYYIDLYFLANGSAVHVCCGVAGPVWVDLATWQVTPADDESTYADAIRPDGRQWANAYWGGVDLAAMDTKAVTAYLPTNSYALSLVYSPDSARLAVGQSDGRAEVWSVAGADPVRQLTLNAAPSDLHDLFWSPDGRTLYTAGGNTLRAWDTATGTQLRSLETFTPGVNFIAWSADGAQVFAQQGGQVTAWNAATGVREQAAPLAEVTYKLMWSDDRSATARAVATELTTSPTGDLMAVGDLYGVTLHAAAGFAPVMRLPTGYRVIVAVFSPDGRYLATAGNSPFVVVWEVATGYPVHALLGSANNYWNVALAFSDDGRALYTLENTGLLRQWDLATETSATVPTPAPVCRACITPIDPAIHPGVGLVATEGTNSISVSRLTSGAEVYRFAAERPFAITINRPGTRVAAIVNGSVRVWSLTDGADLATFTGPSGGFSDLAFSPDGASLAAGSPAGIVQVWPVP